MVLDAKPVIGSAMRRGNGNQSAVRDGSCDQGCYETEEDSTRGEDTTRIATRAERYTEGEVVTKRATILGSSNQK